MEPVKDKQRQADPRQHAPSEHTEKPELQLLRQPVLRDYRVKGPENGITEEQEGYDLTARFCQHLEARDARASRSLGDQRALREALHQLQNRCRQQHDMPRPRVLALAVIRYRQRTGAHHDGEYGVELHAKERHVRQETVQGGRRSRHHRDLAHLYEAAGGHQTAERQYADQSAAGKPGQGGRWEILVLSHNQEDENHHDTGDHTQDTQEKTLAGAVATYSAVAAQILAPVKLLFHQPVPADILTHHEGHSRGD